MTNTTPQSFDTVSALRRASEKLIESLPEEEDSISEQERSTIATRVRDFIEQAVASGVAFDVPADRRAAQAVVDFWVAKSYSMASGQSLNQPPLARTDIQLRSFDPSLVKTSVANAEALTIFGESDDKDKSFANQMRRHMASFGDRAAGIKDSARDNLLRVVPSGVKSIEGKDIARRILLRFGPSRSEKDTEGTLRRILRRIIPLGERNITANNQDIARRILLRIIRFADTGNDFVTSAVKRDDLISLGKPQQVNEVLNALINAGVLSVTPGTSGDLVSLRYDALMRQWPRLRDWIEKRVTFRALATVWDRNGRPTRALLPGGYADRALADYADLGPMELAYIVASSSHSRLRMRLAVGFCAVVLLAALAMVFIRWEHDEEAESAPAEVKEALSTGNSQRQQEAIRRVASLGKPLHLGNELLQNLDLSNLSRDITPALDEFLKSVIVNVNFKAASLPYALFAQTTILRANFTDADLTFARFDEANMIGSTTFSGADLNRVLFDRARLKNVDFSDSNLRSTSFHNVRLEGRLTFTKTAWWLALGWTFPQVTQFANNYKDIDIKDAKFFQADMKYAQDKIKDAATALDRVNAWNNLAWTSAIYGVDLESAKGYADKAVAGIDEIKGTTEWNSLARANLIDTQAYILLQQHNPSKAVDLLQGVEENLKTQNLELSSELAFRYAIALHAFAMEKSGVEGNNLEQRALTYLSTSVQTYAPSHELYLLRSYITGDFEKQLKAMLSCK